MSAGLLAMLFCLLLAPAAGAQDRPGVKDPPGPQREGSEPKTDRGGSGGEAGGAEDGGETVVSGIPEVPADDGRSGLKGDIVNGLPITGLDVIALAAVALSLTAMGLALRLLTPPGEDLG